MVQSLNVKQVYTCNLLQELVSEYLRVLDVYLFKQSTTGIEVQEDLRLERSLEENAY